jgi:hypothetical protein
MDIALCIGLPEGSRQVDVKAANEFAEAARRHMNLYCS